MDKTLQLVSVVVIVGIIAVAAVALSGGIGGLMARPAPKEKCYNIWVGDFWDDETLLVGPGYDCQYHGDNYNAYQTGWIDAGTGRLDDVCMSSAELWEYWCSGDQGKLTKGVCEKGCRMAKDNELGPHNACRKVKERVCGMAPQHD